VRDQLTLIEKAGFVDAVHHGFTHTRTSEYTVGALFTAVKS